LVYNIYILYSPIEVAGKKDLIRKTLVKNTLVFGIILLLIISAVTPLAIGDRVGINGETQITIFEDPPGIEWLQTYGGSETDRAYSVKQTNDGGYIFTGDTQSYGQYGTYDGWLFKTDACGNEQWNKAFGKPSSEKIDIGWDVILTSDGGYVFTGSSRSYNVAGEMEIWLVKTDEDGNEAWNRTYGYGRGFSVHQTQDGGYIIGGGTTNFSAILLKTDIYGNEIWRETFWGYPGDKATGYSVDATTDGGFVLTGPLYYADDDIRDDIFLIKTNAGGVEVINTTFGGPFIETSGESVQQTTDGGFVICGYFADNSVVEGCAWLVKTDVYGNEEWNQTFNEPLNYRMYAAEECKQTLDGGYVLVGRKQPNSGLMDSFLIKTDSNGEKEWELTLEGPQTSDEHIYSVDLTQDGGFIAVGDEGMPSDAFLIKIGHIVNISINKPEDALYFLNLKLRNFQNRNPLIIGPIDRVEFYVDGQLMETDTSVPYSWRWNELSFFSHTLKAVAYNSNGNVGFEEKTVWKFL